VGPEIDRGRVHQRQQGDSTRQQKTQRMGWAWWGQNAGQDPDNVPDNVPCPGLVRLSAPSGQTGKGRTDIPTVLETGGCPGVRLGCQSHHFGVARYVDQFIVQKAINRAA
jgi:hypothetical protein